MLHCIGCHLKNSFNRKGVLLVATTYDGSKSLIVFAIAYVKCENNDNWAWFLNHLKVSGFVSAYPNGRVCFISDREKGLINAVITIFPTCGHRYCLRHIWKNIKTRFPKSTKDMHSLLYRLARSTSSDEYDKCKLEMERYNKGTFE
jgi:hypothetical protein